MLVSRRIYWPSIKSYRPGCVKEVGAEAAKLGLKKALLVRTRCARPSGRVAGKVMESLTAAGCPYVVFDEVQPNPTHEEDVNDALALLKKEGLRFPRFVGGGSPQDAASPCRFLATNGGDVRDYEGIAKSSRRGLPVVAVNTTAGTAAEVTVNYVITEEERKIKWFMVGFPTRSPWLR